MCWWFMSSAALACLEWATGKCDRVRAAIRCAAGPLSQPLRRRSCAWIPAPQGASTDKLTANVSFPLKALRLHQYASPECPAGPDECTYELFAVSNHYGNLTGAAPRRAALCSAALCCAVLCCADPSIDARSAALCSSQPCSLRAFSTLPGILRCLLAGANPASPPLPSPTQGATTPPCAACRRRAARRPGTRSTTSRSRGSAPRRHVPLARAARGAPCQRPSSALPASCPSRTRVAALLCLCSGHARTVRRPCALPLPHCPRSPSLPRPHCCRWCRSTHTSSSTCAPAAPPPRTTAGTTARPRPARAAGSEAARWPARASWRQRLLPRIVG